jgi:hypothetical protein
MVNISRRDFLKGLTGLLGATILGTLIFQYGINKSSYQDFQNNRSNNYSTEISNLDLHNSSFNNLGNRQYYIFWNVPWGPNNGTYKLLDKYFQTNSTITEGVIITFYNNYNHPLEQILYLYENNKNNKPIYVNLFVTTDRNSITDLSQYDQDIRGFLKYLSNITNGGKNIVIGFSEINAVPIEQLAYYYSLMKKYLPEAKLFYYVDMGNSKRIVELHNYLLNNYGIRPDMFGLEVYGDYIYNDGNISMSEYMKGIIIKYKQFADKNNVKFFMGELGFRNGDLKGYISSGGLGYWNGPSEEGYRATIKYYKNIINQLRDMGIEIIGIYNWNGYNGDPFGLWNNPYVNDLIEYMINNSN